MSHAQADKIAAASFASAASTEVYNVYEVAAILKTSVLAVRQRVRAGTLPQPLHTDRAARQWTKAMLTAAGVTAVAP